jgi:hypothetical protein
MFVRGSGVADTAAMITGTWIRLTNSSRSNLLRYIRQALVVMSLCLTLYGSAAGSGSQSCSLAESPPPTVAKHSNYRQVAITAQMPNNQPAPKLTATDLTLYQANKQVPVAFFQQQPATVGILVDTSISMSPKLPASRSAITAFVNDLDPRDDVFLFAFSNRPYMLASLSSDHTTLIN